MRLHIACPATPYEAHHQRLRTAASLYAPAGGGRSLLSAVPSRSEKRVHLILRRSPICGVYTSEPFAAVPRRVPSFHAACLRTVASMSAVQLPASCNGPWRQVPAFDAPVHDQSQAGWPMDLATLLQLAAVTAHARFLSAFIV